MLIKHLKPIDLLVVTDRQKNANGTYTDIYSLKQTYNVKVQELNDVSSKKKYNIRNVPALVINGEVISQGKVLTVREIYKILVN